MLRRLAIATALAVLALPAAAQAASRNALPGTNSPFPTIESRDIPLGGARSLARSVATSPFTMVGLHWQGTGTVSFRTRALDGRWSAWRPAAPEDEDQPDHGSVERTADAAWRIGNPYWTGVADRVEVRTAGHVSRVRSFTIWSSTGPRPLRRVQLAGSPQIVPRSAWVANELITKPSTYAPAVRFAVIHHTAGNNTYTQAQSAAIVQGIQLYHVKGNGWNDIAYNFLVDRFGQVFEGRAGGIDKPVIGAHAEGFNAGSVGIAVIGSYGSTGISKAASDAIANLLAWRLDVAHVDPLSTLTWTSGGNARYPKGIPVFLRAVSGHRDTGFTDCPGDALYRSLGGVATRAAAIGLPKIYEPATTGKPGGLIRFTARLSAFGSWNLTVTDPATATVVARAHGRGLTVDWTWDATTQTAPRFTWTLESSGALPATGTIGRAPAPPPATTTTPGTTTAPPATTTGPTSTPVITGFSLSTTTLSPNGDGANDNATVTYTLTQGAFVSAFVLDQSGTVVAQTLFTDQKQSGRTITFTWDPSPLPDGRYRFVVSAKLPTGESSTAGSDVLVSRTLSALGISPATFSPNGDGASDTTTFTFTLAKPALVALRILAADGSALALPYTGNMAAGPQTITWDGNGVAGRLPDGTYTAQLTATDPTANLVQQVQVTIDTTAPVLTVVNGATLSFSISESATVTVLINGAATTLVAGPGAFQLPPPATTPTLVSAVATDAGGNVSATVSWP